MKTLLLTLVLLVANPLSYADYSAEEQQAHQDLQQWGQQLHQDIQKNADDYHARLYEKSQSSQYSEQLQQNLNRQYEIDRLNDRYRRGY